MRRIGLPIVLAVAGLLVWAPTAGAHASLEASDPAPGSSLASSPEAVTLTFTEPPDPDLTTVEILDVAGTAVPTGEPTLDGPRTVRVDVTEPLSEGSYTMSWRVVSTVDGHLTSGRVVFGVGEAPPAAGADVPTDEVAGPSLGSIAAKSVLYVGLFLLVAVAAIGLWAFGGAPSSLRIVAMAGAVAATVGAVGFLVTEQRAVGVAMGELLSASTGRPLLWLVITVLVADVFAIAGAAKSSWRPLLWGSGAAAAAAMWVRASGGHAAAAVPALPQELAQWAHIVAAGVWVGGLVLLWLLLRERRMDDPPVREVTRYSNVALGAVAVVVGTGIMRALDELGGVGEIGNVLDSTYGRALAAKVGLALALIAMGAVNRRRSIPRLAEDARALRTVVGAEIAVASGVVLLTATLTGAAPNEAASAASAPGPPPPVRTSGIDFATTTAVELTLAPGAPGPSTIAVRVTDPDSGDPLAVDDVSLRVRSVTRPEVAAGSVPLTAQEGAWTATSPAFSLAGTYAVTAVVRTGADAVDVPLVVTTRLPDATQTVDVGPGVPTVTTTTFGDGSSIQTYIDPAIAGTNQVHVTAFSAEGGEGDLGAVTLVAIPEAGEPRRLEVEDFGPGHVVANVDLDAGAWTFDVVAAAEGGRVRQATFEATIGAA